MKFFKIILLCLIVLPLVFLLTTRSDKVKLEGDWVAEKMVLDGKQVYPAEVDRYLRVDAQVTFDGWSTLHFYRDDLEANYKIVKDRNGKDCLMLSSNEKSLNGTFTIELDTLHIGPQSYQVKLKLESGHALINLKKTVIVPPWKPEFPRKGQV